MFRRLRPPFIGARGVHGPVVYVCPNDSVAGILHNKLRKQVVGFGRSSELY